MFAKLPLALLAALTCGPALAATDAPVAYAIDNPQRPGAKAAHCSAQETTDGCTFHSVAGDTYAARLPVGPGEHWVARSADPAEVAFEAQPDAQPQAYQVIKLLPNPARNADASVTFDKIGGQPGALKVIERRRINVMIHPA